MVSFVVTTTSFYRADFAVILSTLSSPAAMERSGIAAQWSTLFGIMFNTTSL
jgi:hypothetical protein